VLESCTVVLPAFNEQDCIRDACIEWLSVAEAHSGKVIVIDDGSTDSTPAILDALAAAHPALFVLHQPNAGHGPTVLRCYREALSTGAEWVFQVDSDRQFLPDDFALLWERRGQAGFLIGGRANRNDRPSRIVLSRLHRRLVRFLFGVDVADPNSPFRLIRASLLARLLDYVPGDAFAPNVMLAILARRGGSLLELQVRHLPRLTGRTFIRGFRTLRMGLAWGGDLFRFRRRHFARFVSGLPLS
jgi:glycosyltransferase involved in cell wall biosynthesis